MKINGGNGAPLKKGGYSMKKLFLIVIGLILMAGTIFSQHNSRNEITIMAEGIGLFVPVSVVPISAELAAKGIQCKSMIIVEKMNGPDTELNFSPDENKFICDDCHEIIEKDFDWSVKELNYSSINTVIKHNQDLEVFCITYISPGRSIVNHKYDITTNGMARKRVDILLL